MEMEFSSVHWHPSLAEKLALLFSLFWPFVAVSLMAGRSRSASPVTAALVPLAACGAAAWLSLVNVAEGVAVSGTRGAAAAAGIAESLTMLFAGVFFALAVIVFAAIRRHRPIVDRLTAWLIAVFLADWIGALAAGAALLNRAVPTTVLFIGATVAAMVAAGAVTWTFLTGRGRVSSTALPHGALIAAVLLVAMGVIVRQIVQGYMDIAMGR